MGSLTVDAQGNLFGVTSTGGANNGGTIFEVAKADTSTIQVLASFDGSSGVSPAGGMVMDTHGNLYGFTDGGGANNLGTVYELAFGAHTITSLAAFPSDSYGPVGAPVMDEDGNLFGVTSQGAMDGGVFELAAGSNTITSLAALDWSTTGAYSSGGLTMDSHGNLYGATMYGGANNYGAIFEVTAADHSLSVLASLDFASGAKVAGTMFIDRQGNLFGTTNFNGANLQGTIFELPIGANTPVALASFDNDTGRAGINDPMMMSSYYDCNLVVDSQGNLFGPTAMGGANGDGTIFELPGAAFVPIVATQVVVTQQPADTTANSTNTLTVKMEDVQGNVDTTINGDVTISIATGPAGASIGGTTTVTAVNGVATFTGLSYHHAGTYTLTVAESSLPSAISNSFTVSAGAAAKLVFAQQPIDSVAGTVMPAIAVKVEDVYGNLVATDSSNVTISIASLVGGAFTGTTTVAASGGIATFSDLAITRTGHYTLEVTDAALTPKVSVAFGITPAAATKLAILQQPGSVTTTHAVSTVLVAVEDVYGNVVSGDHSVITVALINPAGSTLTGTTTATAVNGMVTFDDLSITGSGSHALVASAANLTDAHSTPVAIPQIAGMRLQAIAIDLTNLQHKKNGIFRAELLSGPQGAKLHGHTAVRAQHKHVNFGNIRFRKAGTYTFQISDKHGAVMTQTVVVTARKATHLKFVQEPAEVNGHISTAVSIQDRFGNVVISDHSDITLRLGSVARSNAQLQGTVTAAAANGIATFSDLSINHVGHYRLIAMADMDGQVRSDLFNVI